jgi:hypothetical protein
MNKLAVFPTAFDSVDEEFCVELAADDRGEGSIPANLAEEEALLLSIMYQQ